MARVSRPSLLFEIRQGFPEVMGGSPKKSPRLANRQGLKCPHLYSVPLYSVLAHLPIHPGSGRRPEGGR